MIICVECGTENLDRNYYCKYCGLPLKNGREASSKKLNEKLNYLLDLSIIEDNSLDKNYFSAYTAKRKKC